MYHYGLYPRHGLEKLLPSFTAIEKKAISTGIKGATDGLRQIPAQGYFWKLGTPALIPSQILGVEVVCLELAKNQEGHNFHVLHLI